MDLRRGANRCTGLVFLRQRMRILGFLSLIRSRCVVCSPAIHCTSFNLWMAHGVCGLPLTIILIVFVGTTPRREVLCR